MPDLEDNDRDDEEIAGELGGPSMPSMADSLALGILGAGGAGRRSARGAAQAAAADPQEAARTFLDKQSRMLDIQMEHLHEQRTLILSHLRLRRLNEGFKAALQASACLVAAGITLGIGAMAVQAWRSNALVIEPLRAPPDLAQRGMDGTSLSARLLDKLRALQDATDSARAADTYTDNWGDDIKLEIPETGVSVGELQRYLVHLLGHETHISGEAYRGWAQGTGTGAGTGTVTGPGADPPAVGAPNALFLTVRAGDKPGVTLQGAESGLDGLMQQAAETIYSTTQPYRYGVYLVRHGRLKEAAGRLAGLAAGGSLEDRAWANAQWGGVLILLNGDVRGGEAKERAALALDPDLAIARDNLAGDEAALGHDGAAFAELERERQGLGVGRGRELQEKVRPLMRGWAQARLDAAAGDYASAVAETRRVQALPDYEGVAGAAALEQAAALAMQHDATAARAVLADAGSAGPAASFDRAINWGSALLPEAAIDQAGVDWAAAVRDLTAAEDGAKLGFFDALAVKAVVWPQLAVARAKTGDLAGARALIGQTPLDCYACAVARGRIAAEARDWAGADRWFAEAARQAPALPMAWAAWGQALLARGDLKGALVRLQTARARGPRWADPVEMQGEALLAAGDPAGAQARFAEAARLAPRWGRLQLMWGQAAARLGHTIEAKAHWRAAAGMDLSPEDRAAVGRL